VKDVSLCVDGKRPSKRSIQALARMRRNLFQSVRMGLVSQTRKEAA
jgi:hypothetical protein